MTRLSAASVFASICLAMAVLPARADAQCIDASCLCEPAGANNGVYWARVDAGNQVSVVQVVRANPQGNDPDVIVVPGLSEPPGTEILYTDNGYLVVRGTDVVCAGAAAGGVAVARTQAVQLVIAADCYNDVTLVVPNSCDTGPITCSAATATTSLAGFALAVLGLVAQRRRRSSASINVA
jgi:MYXO-CTERM domain-containing protein